jgi:hypothetical protein
MRALSRLGRRLSSDAVVTQAHAAPRIEESSPSQAPVSTQTVIARSTTLRVGVVLCVATAFATVVVKLNDAIGIFDLRADTNASYTYSQWTHTLPEWSPASGRVLESARLWMPEDATYQIVFGKEFDERSTSDFSHLLLREFLLPRRPTTSAATWIFCYGCKDPTLGGRVEVLAEAPGGPAFGRRLR